MARMLGYMLTCTTYGTWLQGEKKGWVKEGEVFGENIRLHRANEKQMRRQAVHLTRPQKQVVKETVTRKAAELGEEILAIVVWSSHTHIVARCSDRTIEELVPIYKNATAAALRKTGHEGPVWTKGYDVRYCFDQASLNTRIRYVEGHGD